MEEYIIDVKGKPLGRTATEAAVVLRGKHLPSFAPNRLPDIRVRVINIKQLRISEKKREQKVYQRYSGYPGGRKEMTLQRLWKHDPGDVFRHAVRGMLPNNRLRAQALRRLSIE